MAEEVNCNSSPQRREADVMPSVLNGPVAPLPMAQSTGSGSSGSSEAQVAIQRATSSGLTDGPQTTGLAPTTHDAAAIPSQRRSDMAWHEQTSAQRHRTMLSAELKSDIAEAEGLYLGPRTKGAAMPIHFLAASTRTRAASSGDGDDNGASPDAVGGLSALPRFTVVKAEHGGLPQQFVQPSLAALAAAAATASDATTTEEMAGVSGSGTAVEVDALTAQRNNHQPRLPTADRDADCEVAEDEVEGAVEGGGRAPGRGDDGGAEILGTPSRIPESGVGHPRHSAYDHSNQQQQQLRAPAATSLPSGDRCTPSAGAVADASAMATATGAAAAERCIPPSAWQAAAKVAAEAANEYVDAEGGLCDATSLSVPLPAPVEVTVAIRLGGGGRPGDDEARGGGNGCYVRGPACGLFEPELYMSRMDCIRYQGYLVSRSHFEKVGGSNMAKWYRSIRVLPDLEPLGEWLERHGLPVIKGAARRSRPRRPPLPFPSQIASRDADAAADAAMTNGASARAHSPGGTIGTVQGNGNGAAAASPAACETPVKRRTAAPQADAGGGGSSSCADGDEPFRPTKRRNAEPTLQQQQRQGALIRQESGFGSSRRFDAYAHPQQQHSEEPNDDEAEGTEALISLSGLPRGDAGGMTPKQPPPPPSRVFAKSKMPQKADPRRMPESHRGGVQDEEEYEEDEDGAGGGSGGRFEGAFEAGGSARGDIYTGSGRPVAGAPPLLRGLYGGVTIHPTAAAAAAAAAAGSAHGANGGGMRSTPPGSSSLAGAAGLASATAAAAAAMGAAAAARRARTWPSPGDDEAAAGVAPAAALLGRGEALGAAAGVGNGADLLASMRLARAREALAAAGMCGSAADLEDRLAMVGTQDGGLRGTAAGAGLAAAGLGLGLGAGHGGGVMDTAAAVARARSVAAAAAAAAAPAARWPGGTAVGASSLARSGSGRQMPLAAAARGGGLGACADDGEADIEDVGGGFGGAQAGGLHDYLLEGALDDPQLQLQLMTAGAPALLLSIQVEQAQLLRRLRHLQRLERQLQALQHHASPLPPPSQQPGGMTMAGLAAGGGLRFSSDSSGGSLEGSFHSAAAAAAAAGAEAAAAGRSGLGLLPVSALSGALGSVGDIGGGRFRAGVLPAAYARMNAAANGRLGSRLAAEEEEEEVLHGGSVGGLAAAAAAAGLTQEGLNAVIARHLLEQTRGGGGGGEAPAAAARASLLTHCSSGGSGRPAQALHAAPHMPYGVLYARRTSAFVEGPAVPGRNGEDWA